MNTDIIEYRKQSIFLFLEGTATRIFSLKNVLPIFISRQNEDWFDSILTL